MSAQRQTLTLSIATRDAEVRLALLLAEARHYADEIVVGVDRASVDGTWDVAVAGADRVFGFVHDGVASPARMAGLERASCDWILYLDDDEGMDAAFPALRDELLGVAAITHWWLPRKWLTSFDPPEYLHADPWWPSWSLRLARADTSRIWKPRDVHSGLRVIGPRGMESRTSILHYERLDHSTASREARVAVYRVRGQDSSLDRFYADDPAAPRAAVTPPPLRDPSAVLPRRPRARVDSDIDDLDARPRFPPWGADVSVEMTDRAKPGEVLLVAARARNTGTLRWESSSSLVWPDLSLAYRVRCADGTFMPDRADRTRVGRDVLPGESTDFICKVHVPPDPGEYVLEWQMLSELEHWFDSLGSPTERCPLSVTA
jgi:glycosyltransferase involved in cell wall biosynthesis